MLSAVVELGIDVQAFERVEAECELLVEFVLPVFVATAVLHTVDK